MKHRLIAFALLGLTTAASAAESIRVDQHGYVQSSFFFRQAEEGKPATVTNFLDDVAVSTKPMSARVFARIALELRESFPGDGAADLGRCGDPVRIAWSKNRATPRTFRFCPKGDEPALAALREWYLDVQPLR